MTQDPLFNQAIWFTRMQELTEANLEAIQQLREQTAQNSADIRETRAIADSNARVIQSLCQLAAEDREERQQMLADIRGLQAENRRILDILLNQQQGNQE